MNAFRFPVSSILSSFLSFAGACVGALVLALALALAVFPVRLEAQKTPQQPDPELVRKVVEEDDFDEYALPEVFDPLEPLNRLTFKFNEGVYDYVLRPVSKGYAKVVPGPVRSGLTNFFDNIRFPVRFVGCVLQGKFRRAGKETGKFVVNTLGGLGGFIRQSDNVPALADVPREDLGQTFGRWGIGAGPYLVLPILGPGSVRDTVGQVGDSLLNPVGWRVTKEEVFGGWEVQTAVYATDVINETPDLLRIFDAAAGKNAIDPYIATRNAYLQYREAAVKQ
ncbi:MAG: VacJ family lipoprotein [Opitutaceae bacterium]|jgi:phospholipid-binding lipoprotein MlaA|nr:VacJ family lipoprotein [Opitutaceae bacterium]